MDDRLIARLIAAGRVLFGVLCIASPKLLLQKQAAVTPGQAIWMLRAFGIRDVVLGAGALASLNADEPDPDWVRMGAIADSADAVAALAFRKELGPQALIATLSLAVPASLLGWKSAMGLARRSAGATR